MKEMVQKMNLKLMIKLISLNISYRGLGCTLEKFKRKLLKISNRQLNETYNAIPLLM